MQRGNPQLVCSNPFQCIIDVYQEASAVKELSFNLAALCAQTDKGKVLPVFVIYIHHALCRTRIASCDEQMVYHIGMAAA